MSKQHNRRQRKKLHLGEFQELGFAVSAALREGVSAADAELVCDSFISERIEATRLAYGGAIVDKLDGFVTAYAGRASATEAQRGVVRDWLEARPELMAVDVGPLVDGWYGHD
ncbi:YggL family protein [Paraburkholderia sp. EG304]|uniref:YggL 50S ribosome-binding family protein n=1 Tax=Paraburkholderia sp. EG304 TaxID=3237015 RepID=UPI003977F909